MGAKIEKIFNIDITDCEACEKFNVRIVACITEGGVFNQIFVSFGQATFARD